MRNSTCFTMTVVFISAAVAALICAIVFDGMDDSSKSIIFGCIACACAIPAYSCASILYQSGKKQAKEQAEEQLEEAAEDSEEAEEAEAELSEENSDAE